MLQNIYSVSHFVFNYYWVYGCIVALSLLFLKGLTITFPMKYYARNCASLRRLAHKLIIQLNQKIATTLLN